MPNCASSTTEIGCVVNGANDEWVSLLPIYQETNGAFTSRRWCVTLENMSGASAMVTAPQYDDGTFAAHVNLDGGTPSENVVQGISSTKEDVCYTLTPVSDKEVQNASLNFEISMNEGVYTVPIVVDMLPAKTIKVELGQLEGKSASGQVTIPNSALDFDYGNCTFVSDYLWIYGIKAECSVPIQYYQKTETNDNGLWEASVMSGGFVASNEFEGLLTALMGRTKNGSYLLVATSTLAARGFLTTATSVGDGKIWVQDFSTFAPENNSRFSLGFNNAGEKIGTYESVGYKSTQGSATYFTTSPLVYAHNGGEPVYSDGILYGLSDYKKRVGVIRNPNVAGYDMANAKNREAVKEHMLNTTIHELFHCDGFRLSHDDKSQANIMKSSGGGWGLTPAQWRSFL